MLSVCQNIRVHQSSRVSFDCDANFNKCKEEKALLECFHELVSDPVKYSVVKRWRCGQLSKQKTKRG